MCKQASHKFLRRSINVSDIGSPAWSSSVPEENNKVEISPESDWWLVSCSELVSSSTHRHHRYAPSAGGLFCSVRLVIGSKSARITPKLRDNSAKLPSNCVYKRYMRENCCRMTTWVSAVENVSLQQKIVWYSISENTPGLSDRNCLSQLRIKNHTSCVISCSATQCFLSFLSSHRRTRFLWFTQPSPTHQSNRDCAL